MSDSSVVIEDNHVDISSENHTNTVEQSNDLDTVPDMENENSKSEVTESIQLQDLCVVNDNTPYSLSNPRILIGRNDLCDIRLRDPQVSGKHCIIENGILRDVGSTNGTYLNGERVLDSVLLSLDDVITCGGKTLVVQLTPAFNSSETIDLQTAIQQSSTNASSQLSPNNANSHTNNASTEIPSTRRYNPVKFLNFKSEQILTAMRNNANVPGNNGDGSGLPNTPEEEDAPEHQGLIPPKLHLPSLEELLSHVPLNSKSSDIIKQVYEELLRTRNRETTLRSKLFAGKNMLRSTNSEHRHQFEELMNENAALKFNLLYGERIMREQAMLNAENTDGNGSTNTNNTSSSFSSTQPKLERAETLVSEASSNGEGESTTGDSTATTSKDNEDDGVESGEQVLIQSLRQTIRELEESCKNYQSMLEAHEEELEDLKKDNKSLVMKNEKYTSEIDVYTSEIRDLQAKVEDSDQMYNIAKEDSELLQVKLQDLTSRYDIVVADLRVLEKEKDKLLAQVQEQQVQIQTLSANLVAAANNNSTEKEQEPVVDADDTVATVAITVQVADDVNTNADTNTNSNTNAQEHLEQQLQDMHATLQTKEDEIKQLSDKLACKTEEYTVLAQDFADLKTTTESQASELASLKQTVDTLETQVQELTGSLHTNQQELTKIRKEYTELQDKYTDMQTKHEEVIKTVTAAPVHEQEQKQEQADGDNTNVVLVKELEAKLSQLNVSQNTLQSRITSLEADNASLREANTKLLETSKKNNTSTTTNDNKTTGAAASSAKDTNTNNNTSTSSSSGSGSNSGSGRSSQNPSDELTLTVPQVGILTTGAVLLGSLCTWYFGH